MLKMFEFIAFWSLRSLRSRFWSVTSGSLLEFRREIWGEMVRRWGFTERQFVDASVQRNNFLIPSMHVISGSSPTEPPWK